MVHVDQGPWKVHCTKKYGLAVALVINPSMLAIPNWVSQAAMPVTTYLNATGANEAKQNSVGCQLRSGSLRTNH